MSCVRVPMSCVCVCVCFQGGLFAGRKPMSCVRVFSVILHRFIPNPPPTAVPQKKACVTDHRFLTLYDHSSRMGR